MDGSIAQHITAQHSVLDMPETFCILLSEGFNLIWFDLIQFNMIYELNLIQCNCFIMLSATAPSFFIIFNQVKHFQPEQQLQKQGCHSTLALPVTSLKYLLAEALQECGNCLNKPQKMVKNSIFIVSFFFLEFLPSFAMHLRAPCVQTTHHLDFVEFRLTNAAAQCSNSFISTACLFDTDTHSHTPTPSVTSIKSIFTFLI